MITDETLNGYRAMVAREINEVAKGQLSREDVDDLIQDVFLYALGHLNKGEDVTAAWLKLLAKGRAINLLKASAHTNVSLDDKITDDEGNELDCIPESLIDRDTPEGLYAVREFIEGLTDEDREIIEMLAGGSTPDEIAAEMGVSAATIYRRVVCFRRQLGE